MKGVLLINTGSPKSNHPKDLRNFQEEILKDPFVINPAHGIPEFTSEPSSSDQNDASFHEISKRFLKKIQDSNKIPVALVMHYGYPTIASGFQELEKKGVKEILVLPFYPQFATSTVDSVIRKVNEIQNAHFPAIAIEYIHTYYDRIEYIDVMVESITKAVDSINDTHVIFSYHGVPEHFSMERDFSKNQCTVVGACCDASSDNHKTCYKKQCGATSAMIAEKLDIKPNAYTTAFQSRLGLEPWLQPTTKQVFEHLLKEGVKNITLVFPGFATDCQDTEKTAFLCKRIFTKIDGKTCTVVPCLNDSDAWVEVVSRWIFRWRITDFKTAIA